MVGASRKWSIRWSARGDDDENLVVSREEGSAASRELSFLESPACVRSGIKFELMTSVSIKVRVWRAGEGSFMEIGGDGRFVECVGGK